MSCESMRAITWLDLLKEYIKGVWVSSESGLFSMSGNKYLLAVRSYLGLRNDDWRGAATGRDRPERVGVGSCSSESHSHDLKNSSEGIYRINVLRCIYQDVSCCFIVSEIRRLRTLGQHPVVRDRSKNLSGTQVCERLRLCLRDEQQC